jgi:hypothetical protein
MTNLNTLLNKGNLTGEEVGRIFLRDFARFVGAVQNEQEPPKDKFTEAEKQAMVNKLTESYDIRQYNTYTGIIRFLQKTAILYKEHYNQLKYLLLALMHEIDIAKHIEAVRLLSADAPLILTEPQYKRAKKENLDSKLDKKTSVAGIILTACKYYLEGYKLEPHSLDKGKTEKEKEEIAKREALTIVKELRVDKNLTIEQIEGLQRQQPYGLLFKAYKKQPLTNPKFKKNYWGEGANGHYETLDGKSSKDLPQGEWAKECSKWQEKGMETGEDYIKWINDSREAPPEATKYDILEYLQGYFGIGENTTNEDLETFKKDYPDIYEAILTELKGVKGLGINDIKDYTKPLIEYKTLYDLDLPYYREYFKFNPDDEDNSFIATFISVIPDEEIKHWSNWKKEHYLDKEGDYKYQLTEHEKRELAETLPHTIDRAKEHLKYLFAIQEIYRILGEQLNEACITELATDKQYALKEGEETARAKELGIPNTGLVYQLIRISNERLEDLKRGLRKTSPVLSKDTVKEIHEKVEALELIKIKELRPKKEAITEVKELTKDLNYYEQRGLSLYDILMGEI